MTNYSDSIYYQFLGAADVFKKVEAGSNQFEKKCTERVA